MNFEKLGEDRVITSSKFPSHFLMSSSYHVSVCPSPLTLWIAKDSSFLFNLSSSHPLDWAICTSYFLVLSPVTLKPLLSLPGSSFNFRISIRFTISIPLPGRGPQSKFSIIGPYFYSCWVSWVSSMWSFSWRCVRSLGSVSPLRPLNPAFSQHKLC